MRDVRADTVSGSTCEGQGVTSPTCICCFAQRAVLRSLTRGTFCMSLNIKWLPVSALIVVAACGSPSLNSSNRTSVELAAGSPYGVVVDSTSVYWTGMGSDIGGEIIGTVMKVPLGGG